ncbi:MAG: hypothetical protein WC376_00295 [Candidatus Nanoarchaeia archaeon]|jgi:hypothetical protein
MFKLFCKNKKLEKKPSKKYWIAAIFFAIMAPAVLISKINSRKKKL